MVKTTQNLLTKSDDPYEALLAYRATPLENGFSPAELCMGRRLRTTLPTTPSKLTHYKRTCTVQVTKYFVDYPQKHLNP